MATITATAAPVRTQSFTQTSAISGPLVLLGRLFFGLIFIMAGPNQFSGQTIAYAASHGVPAASLAVPLAGVLAIVGGLSVLLGYRAKIGAWLIALFLIGVTPAMHNFWAVSDPMAHQMQFIHFMKNLSMLGGALLITQLGAGPWSLDSRSQK